MNNVIRNNLVKKIFYDELIKKANANDSNKQTKKKKKKIGYVDSKIPDTSQFIAIHEFNRLTKINLSIYRTNKKLKQ